MRMKEKRVTVATRLELLLPWFNGDVDEPGEALDRFLALTMAAWGDVADGVLLGVEVEPGGRLTARQWANLRQVLVDVLETTAEPLVGRTPPLHALPSLRFGVSRIRERPAKLPRGARERRAVEGPGAFRRTVSGRLRDVVRYAFERTLTEPGTVHLARCPAPAPRDWSRTCGRWFLKGGRRGPAARYCSERCRVRAWRVKDSDYGGKNDG